MIFIKYCEKEFNITEHCNTLQLGTFEYYRELDADFSIADAEEGYVHISAEQKSNIEVPYDKWNRLFGQIMHIDEKGNIKIGGNQLQKLPGSIKFEANDGNFIFDGEKKVLKFNSDIDFKFFYPNSYIFCISIVENKASIDPSKVDEKYDSNYEISEKKLPQFLSYVSELLVNSVRLADFTGIDQLMNMPLSAFTGEIECLTIMRPVSYVEEKRLLVSTAEDFDHDKFFDLYFNGLFKKDKKYADNKELRLVFALRHKKLGFLSVRKEPILVNLKPILGYLET